MKKILLISFVFFSVLNSKAQLASETIIGRTMYDVQCNDSPYGQLVHNADGTMSAVWNFSPDSTTNFPNRGTAYNYFDGANWAAMPTTRIDPYRTGYSSIVTTSSGHEITIQHTGTGMSVNYCPVKGSGSWSASKPWGTNNYDTWAKSASDGDSVYAIWHGTGTSGTPIAGQDGPLYFVSSFDGGQTWSPKTIIHEIDSTFYSGFGGEHYDIDASAGVVAILFGDPRTDLGVLKSHDGGATWTKTIIETNPLPRYGNFVAISDTNSDGIIDTVQTSSGNQSLLIDNDGMCHVWFTQLRWYCDISTVGIYNYFPFDDGLQYWNEAMGTDNFIKIAEQQDLNGNGILDDALQGSSCVYIGGPNSYRLSKTGFPSAGIDANGTIYLAYQTQTENSDSALFGRFHTHPFVSTLPKIAGSYNYWNWTYPFDITITVAEGGNSEFEEGVFPTMARRVSQYAYIMYERDQVPGLHTTSCGILPDSYTNEIVVAQVYATTVGVKELQNDMISAISVSPNPASDKIVLQFLLKEKGNGIIEIKSMTGTTYYSRPGRVLSKGLNVEEISVADFPAGVYFCSLIVNGKIVVEKLVVSH